MNSLGGYEGKGKGKMVDQGCRPLWRGSLVEADGRVIHDSRSTVHPSPTGILSTPVASSITMSDLCLDIEMLRHQDLRISRQVEISHGQSSMQTAHGPDQRGKKGAKSRIGILRAGKKTSSSIESLIAGPSVSKADVALEKVEIEDVADPTSPVEVRLYIDPRCYESIEWAKGIFCRGDAVDVLNGRTRKGVVISLGESKSSLDDPFAIPTSEPVSSDIILYGRTMDAVKGDEAIPIQLMVVKRKRPPKKPKPRPDDPLPRENLFTQRLRRTASQPVTPFEGRASNNLPLNLKVQKKSLHTLSTSKPTIQVSRSGHPASRNPFAKLDPANLAGTAGRGLKRAHSALDSLTVPSRSKGSNMSNPPDTTVGPKRRRTVSSELDMRPSNKGKSAFPLIKEEVEQDDRTVLQEDGDWGVPEGPFLDADAAGGRGGRKEGHYSEPFNSSSNQRPPLNKARSLFGEPVSTMMDADGDGFLPPSPTPSVATNISQIRGVSPTNSVRGLSRAAGDVGVGFGGKGPLRAGSVPVRLQGPAFERSVSLPPGVLNLGRRGSHGGGGGSRGSERGDSFGVGGREGSMALEVEDGEKNGGNVVLDRNKASIKKIVLASLTAVGVGRQHPEFKELFGQICKGTQFALRATLTKKLIDKEVAKDLVNGHIAMYCCVATRVGHGAPDEMS